MLGPPLAPFGLMTIAWPTQPPWGRLRPLATPCGHLIDAKGTLWRLRALPSASSEVASTTMTKAVDRPVTARRNQADRVQGSIRVLSEGEGQSLSRIWLSADRFAPWAPRSGLGVPLAAEDVGR